MPGGEMRVMAEPSDLITARLRPLECLTHGRVVAVVLQKPWEVTDGLHCGVELPEGTPWLVAGMVVPTDQSLRSRLSAVPLSRAASSTHHLLGSWVSPTVRGVTRPLLLDRAEPEGGGEVAHPVERMRSAEPDQAARPQRPRLPAPLREHPVRGAPGALGRDRRPSELPEYMPGVERLVGNQVLQKVTLLAGGDGGEWNDTRNAESVFGSYRRGIRCRRLRRGRRPHSPYTLRPPP